MHFSNSIDFLLNKSYYRLDKDSSIERLPFMRLEKYSKAQVNKSYEGNNESKSASIVM